MSLSIRSQTFHDTRQELKRLKNEGYLSKENFRDTVRQLGVDPDAFIEADKEYGSALKSGETNFTGRGLTAGLTGDIPVVSDVQRIGGRLVGATVEGVTSFASALTPDFIEDAVGSVASGVGSFIPDSVKEYSQELFDPYHGNSTYGGVEQGIGEIGSYFIPGGAVVKGFNLASKGVRAASPATRALLRRSAVKMGKRGNQAAKVAGYGLAGAFGTTVIEDPRENLYDQLMEEPDGEEIVARLEQDPNDPTALDYLDAFVKNSIIEVPAAMLLGLPSYLRKANKARRAGQPKQRQTFIGKLGDKWGEKFSSRMGTDDKTLASIIERHGAAKAAVIRADGVAKDLDKTIKKEITNYTPEIEVKLNNALQYSDMGLTNAENAMQFILEKEQRMINKINNADPSKRAKMIKKLEKFRKTDKAAVQNQLRQVQRNKVDYDELGDMAPESRLLIDEMRNNIDDLSTYVSQNVVKGDVKGTIAGNKGFYLNRSYAAFDEPEYAKQLKKRLIGYQAGEQDDIIEGVEQYLRQSGIEEAKIPETIEELVQMAGNDTAKVLQTMGVRGLGKSIGAGTSKALSKRGDIAQPIRALWGEYTDPMKNYVKTFEKLAMMKAEDKFLKEIAADLTAKGIAKKGTPSIADDVSVSLGDIADTRLGKIFGRGNVEKGMINNPLENVYIDPTYAKAIAQGLEEITPTEGWAKAFMGAKGATQTAKTVLSPATHGRNLIGNIIMLIANGIVPGFNSSKKALEQVASRLAGKNNKQLAEDAARYAELGISDSGIGVNLIRRNIKALTEMGADKWVDKLAVTRGTKNVNNFLTNLYQAEDDLFKIIHFEKTKDSMRKAFPDKPLKEIEEMAAQRTRDLMPNYSLVPRIVKDMRGLPIGDFIAFPAEMIRTSKNLVKYTIKDLTSGNPELQKAAAKRLAGMTTAGLGGDALAEHSRQYFGITDAQEDAIDGIVPSYEQGQNRIYMSGINKDNRGHVGVNYVNLGPLDPYAYIKTGAKSLHKIIADGTLNERDLEIAYTQLFDNQLGPFLEPSMITKSMIDLVNGKTYEDETSLMGKIQKGVKTAIDPFVPGVASYLEKRYNYEQSKKDSMKIVSPFAGNFGDGANLPEGITPSSFTISGYDQTFGGDVGIPAFFGVRNQRLDMTAGIQYALNPTIGKIKNSDRSFYDFIRNQALTPEDSPEIYKEYKDTQKKRLNGFQELKALSDNYRTLFGDNYAGEIAKGITMRGKKGVDRDVWNYLNMAASNYFAPSMPDFGIAQRASRAPIPYNDISKLYFRLNGTKIEED